LYRCLIRSVIAVQQSACGGFSPIQAKKIKLAVESSCEMCREYVPLSLLEIHRIGSSSPGKAAQGRGPEERVLVVCPLCHQHIHCLPVPVRRLRALARKRPFHMRRDIRLALGYVPKPYTPPDDQDLAKIYDEALKLSSFRVSG
jgi:hypothetical protein